MEVWNDGSLHAKNLGELFRQNPAFWDACSWPKECLPAGSLQRSLETAAYGQGPDVRRAFARWEEWIRAGRYQCFSLYSEKECAEDPDKKNVRLMFFKGNPGQRFHVICPGGAYTHVAAWLEGVAPAMALAEEGYNAFVLVYRCDYACTASGQLMPKPMEDLAKALNFILKNKDDLQADTKKYGVSGFSAGGHLAAFWGTKEEGCAHYQLPAPSALILGYPALSAEIYYELLQGTAMDSYPEAKAMTESYLRLMGGPAYTHESIRKFSAEYHVTGEYPCVYMVHNEDDPLVPYETSQRFCSALEKAGVTHVFESYRTGGHGFSLGYGKEACGWYKRALKFWIQSE